MVATHHTYFTNKKLYVSFTLSLLVFFIHFYEFSTFSTVESITRGILYSVRTLTHVAVPLFFVISGALFYRNYTLAMTAQKWKNRFFSLCVPYLIWNTLWLLLALLGYYTPLGLLTGGVKTAFSLEAVLKGIFLHGQFEPFWFILQLIVLTALCPVVYLLLKNKWVGIITITAFYMLYCFGFRLHATLFANTSMVIFYLLGAWLGIHYFDFFASRKKKTFARVGVIVYILCCVFVGMKPLFPEWCPVVQIEPIVYAISCGAFWVSFDCFEMRKCPGFLKDSFLIYATHSFVGAALAKILQMLLPSSWSNILLLIAILSFIGTIVVICTFGMLLEKYAPRLKKILTGR